MLNFNTSGVSTVNASENAVPRYAGSGSPERCTYLIRVAALGLSAAICGMSAAASAQSDPTQTFLLTTNNPIPSYSDNPTLPVIAGSVPDDGLLLSSKASQYFTMIFGSGQQQANILTGQNVRDDFFLNYSSGNLDQTIGSPMDTGQASNNVFAAVARHYAVGDPSDLHVMLPDGLHLRAACAGVPKQCTPGNVYAAMIRFQAEFRPGMTLEVRYKSAPGLLSWDPIWLFQGMQISPGAGEDAYSHGYDQTGALIQYGRPFEIDVNDNFVRAPLSPVGSQLDFGLPAETGQTYTCHSPYLSYAAQGSGYNYITGGAPPFESLPFDWSAGFHDIVMSWSATNFIRIFVDGERVQSFYNEYPQTTYTDIYDQGKVKTVPLNLVIGNQAIPAFAPNNLNPLENEGLGADGWAIVIQKVAAWYGTVTGVHSIPNVASGRQPCS